PMEKDTKVISGNMSISASISPDRKHIVRERSDKPSDNSGSPAVFLTAEFSPDGERMVTCQGDVVCIWEVRSGQLLTGPMKHTGIVRAAGFSPDGERILTISEDDTTRLWDARTAQPLTDIMRHLRRVQSVRFSRDGRRLVSITADNITHVWDA